jgi:gamma-glutamylcysteine synthetase
MDENAFDTYVQERYENQLKYYSNASAKNQKKYKQFQWILIVLSALTPVIAALNTFSVKIAGHELPLSSVVVVISSVVAILTTGLKTFNYQELWITYRSTYEKLKPEIHYYHFNVGEYGKPGIDKESLFVSRVESLLDAEHAQWPPARKMQDDANKTNADNKQASLNNGDAKETSDK